jgi:hypothetical protein
LDVIRVVWVLVRQRRRQQQRLARSVSDEYSVLQSSVAFSLAASLDETAVGTSAAVPRLVTRRLARKAWALCSAAVARRAYSDRLAAEAVRQSAGAQAD